MTTAILMSVIDFRTTLKYNLRRMTKFKKRRSYTQPIFYCSSVCVILLKGVAFLNRIGRNLEQKYNTYWQNCIKGKRLHFASQVGLWLSSILCHISAWKDVSNLNINKETTGRSRGVLGACSPLAPKIFSKSCSFQVIFREKPLFWANFWGPGQNSTDPPPDQNPLSATGQAVFDHNTKSFGFFETDAFVDNCPPASGLQVINALAPQRSWCFTLGNAIQTKATSTPMAKTHQAVFCLRSYFSSSIQWISMAGHTSVLFPPIGFVNKNNGREKNNLMCSGQKQDATPWRTTEDFHTSSFHRFLKKATSVDT